MTFRSRRCLAAAALACAAQWAGAQTPVISDVSITSSPASGDTYGLAEIIEISVTFDRAVTVTGRPEIYPGLESTQGGQPTAYYYEEGSTSTVLAFRYAVQPMHADTDGISITGRIWLHGGRGSRYGLIRSQAATCMTPRCSEALLQFGSHSIRHAANHKVDGSIETAPTVESVSITSSPSSGDTYQLAEVIEVQVTFDRAVDVSGPLVALTIGSATRRALWHFTDEDAHRANNGYLTSIRFRYSVVPSDTDADGISVGAIALTTWLSGHIRIEGGTTNAVLDLGTHAISNSANHKVDGSQESAPIVTGVSITSRPAGGSTYDLASVVEIEVTFDRSVSVTGADAQRTFYRSGGGPQLALTIGSATRQAHYLRAGALERTLEFNYVVQSSDMDADGISIGASALTLNGGAIRTRGGAVNAALGLGSHAIANAANHKVDGSDERRPDLFTVYVASAPSSGDTYRSGETIRVRVGFTAPLDVTGAPQLALAIGSVTRQASYDVASLDWRHIDFVYTVQLSDVDADGISIGTGRLTLNGGTIKIRGGTTDAGVFIDVTAAISNAAQHKVDGSGRSIASTQDGDARNAAPRLADELARLELDVGETRTVDLASAFEDPNDDPLRYAASSDGGAVSVQVVHGALNVRGLSPGETTVTVTATDPEGLSATTTFDVAVGVLLSLSGNAAAPEGGTAVLTATLSKALAVPLDVSWHVAPDDDPSTPDADASDSERTGETTIPAGETTGVVEVAIADDDHIEPAREYFVVALDQPQNPNVGLSYSRRARAAIQEGVCDRTPAVRDELARDWRGCHWPKPRDLARIRTVDLRERAIDALRPNDLLGLAGLRRLDLSGNALSSLPDGLFAGLGRLREVSVEHNPGAPFALAVQLTRTDADPWAAGPAAVSARAAIGAPFAMASPLVLAPAGDAESGAPAMVRIATGETTGTAFTVRPTAGAALVLRADAAPMPTTRCGALACLRGFAPVPGPALTLFHRPPQALAAPTPQPLQEGGALRLPLDSLIAPGDAPDGMLWEASSSDESLARARIAGADLLVDSELASEGTVEITLTATDAYGLAATLRFEVQVAFHWPSGPTRGWRATLHNTTDNAGTRAR